MNTNDKSDAKKERRPAPQRHTTSRLGRFAKLSSMTAGVTARQVTTRVVSAFQNEEDAEAARKRALEQSADQIVETMGQLKGAAMKVGQMLSADPEVLPEELSDALSRLQAEAPPMDFDTVKSVVEEALDAPLDELFTEFSREPIGAASIGQVHRGRTIDGMDVAVKVQYPGISHTIESDMKNLGSLLQLARAKVSKERVDRYIREVTEVIKRESDYLSEADTLERFQIILKNVDGVRVPLPVHEYTRRTVLTMEYIEGMRLVDWMTDAPDEKRQEKAEQLIAAYLEMVHIHHTLHADPHPGNFLVDQDENVVFLDLGCVRDYDRSFSEGLIEVIESMWEADLDRLMAILEKMEWEHNGIDPELIYEWMELILTPLLEDEPVNFGEWRIHDKAMRFIKENPSFLGFAPPQEALFYVRVLAGLRGVLAMTHASVNAYQIAQAAVCRLRAS